jgi:hypothetical protein
MAERILKNLQKGLADNTISIAAGLEKVSLYSSPPQALPYYQFTNISSDYDISKSS